MADTDEHIGDSESDKREHERARPMADDAVGVLREQVNDLKRQVANLEDIRSRNRTKIGAMRKEIEDLRNELASVRAELDERVEAQGDVETLAEQIEEWAPMIEDYESVKNENSTLTEELESVKTELSELREEHDSLTQKHEHSLAQMSLPPDEANAKYRELQSKWQRHEHERAFADALHEFKDDHGNHIGLNTRVEMTDVWGRIGYVPEGEMPEATEVIERLREARSKAPFLFTSGVTPTNGDTRDTIVSPREPVPPGPGAGRGNTPTRSGVLNVPPGQLYNNQTVMDTTSLNEFTEAYTGKRLRTQPVQPPAPPRR